MKPALATKLQTKSIFISKSKSLKRAFVLLFRSKAIKTTFYNFATFFNLTKKIIKMYLKY